MMSAVAVPLIAVGAGALASEFSSPQEFFSWSTPSARGLALTTWIGLGGGLSVAVDTVRTAPPTHMPL